MKAWNPNYKTIEKVINIAPLENKIEISKIVNDKPYITIKIKSDTIIRIVLSIILIIIGNLVYSYIVKPTIYQKQ